MTAHTTCCQHPQLYIGAVRVKPLTVHPESFANIVGAPQPASHFEVWIGPRTALNRQACYSDGKSIEKNMLHLIHFLIAFRVPSIWRDLNVLPVHQKCHNTQKDKHPFLPHAHALPSHAHIFLNSFLWTIKLSVFRPKRYTTKQEQWVSRLTSINNHEQLWLIKKAKLSVCGCWVNCRPCPFKAYFPEEEKSDFRILRQVSWLTHWFCFVGLHLSLSRG